MKDWQDDFEALGVNVAAMTYDKASALAEFGEDSDVVYPLLSDGSSEFFKALGVRNEQYPEGHPGHGVALPGILFIDPAGVVRMKRAHEDYRIRPSFDEVHGAVRSLVEVD